MFQFSQLIVQNHQLKIAYLNSFLALTCFYILKNISQLFLQFFFIFKLVFFPLKTTSIIIKKNLKHLSLFTNYWRYLRRHPFFFKIKFRNNKFFNFLNKKKIINDFFFLKKKKILNNNFFFFTLYNKLQKNWNFLIEGAVSIESWQFSNFTVHINSNTDFTVKKNFFETENTSKFLYKNIKKLFFKNYNYFNSLYLDYSDLFYTLKWSDFSLFSYLMFNHLREKPYLFLNDESGLCDPDEFIKMNTTIWLNYKTYFDLLPVKQTRKFSEHWHVFWKTPTILQTIKLNKINYFFKPMFFFKKINDNKKNKIYKSSLINNTLLTFKSITNFFFAQSKYFTDIEKLKTQKTFLTSKPLFFLNTLFKQKKLNFYNYIQIADSSFADSSLEFFWNHVLINSFQTLIEKNTNLKLHFLIKNRFFKKPKKSKDLLLPLRNKWVSLYYYYFDVFNVKFPKLNLFTNSIYKKNYKIKKEAYTDFLNCLNEDCKHTIKILPFINVWPEFINIKSSLLHKRLSLIRNVPFFLFNKLQQKITTIASLINNSILFFKFDHDLQNEAFTFSQLTSFDNLEKSYVFINYQKIIFFSYYQLNFLSQFEGFLYLTNDLVYDNNFYDYSELKKNLCSFSSKFDVHRWIVKNYLKNQIFELFYHENVNEIEDDSFYLNNFFFLKSSSVSCFNIKNNLNSLIAIPQHSSSFQFSIPQIDSIFDSSRIKRIKFKPGYKKIWKEARLIIKKSLNLKFRYQYKLTRYLFKFKKFSRLDLVLFFEMSLLNVLIKSNFIYYNEFILIFIKNNLIFINGSSCTNPKFQLYVNDFIQFIITIKYYLTFKLILNHFSKKKINFKNKLKKKTTLKSNLDKKINNSLPNWILSETVIENDINSYLELDYFTLSIFILYEPFLLNELNLHYIGDIKYNIINMYNWKYIT